MTCLPSAGLHRHPLSKIKHKLFFDKKVLQAIYFHSKISWALIVVGGKKEGLHWSKIVHESDSISNFLLLFLAQFQKLICFKVPFDFVLIRVSSNFDNTIDNFSHQFTGNNLQKKKLFCPRKVFPFKRLISKDNSQKLKDLNAFPSL